jgi:hypothetical protein
MPIVRPSKDKAGLFQIVLPQDPTAEQTALKEKIDTLIEKIKRNESSPDYLTRVKKLQAIAESGFDAPKANPAVAIKDVDALADEVRPLPEIRASSRQGAYEVKLPDPETTPEDKGYSWREIIYETVGELTPVPPEQLKFKTEAEATLTTLQAILPDEDLEQKPKILTAAQRRFSAYQTKLLGIARIGLETPADPESARLWLEALHDEVLTREGPRIKNGYMMVLGTWALASASLAAAAYLVLSNNPQLSTLLSAYRNLFVLWTGMMVGAWLSFGIRRQTISFKDLRAPEDDMVEPGIRLIFTGLIGVAIAFVFMCGMVTVNIGRLSSGDLLVHGSSALLIGILFGVSELALPAALTRRASQFVSEVSGKT